MTRRTMASTPAVRCAIYTRKSSEEGLDQEFNSLDAQRAAAEAYIASQKSEGWTTLPDRYDDGGFTGGNIERPALRRLVSDIEAGQIDTVIVYKVDRLSRSLMDFARLMEIFERHNVSFVSVTQHFNTTHSMGRLTLNILLSFAQFEREIIGERIRDKIAASRQRGRWTGGVPILGYDVDRSGASPQLVINASEAIQVREIFDLYLDRGSILSVVKVLTDRGWKTKSWMAKNGNTKGGVEWDKGRLYHLLTNILYAGKVRHRDKTYDGIHEAIISEDVFARVQKQLAHNGRHIGPATRNQHGALLRGLLFCKSCGKAMSHTFTTRGGKRYRYYTCTNVIKRGRRRCSTPSLPAAEIERVTVEEIACIGPDPAVIDATLESACTQANEAIKTSNDEKAILKRSLRRCHDELRTLAGDEADGAKRRSADVSDQIDSAERRLAEIEARLATRRAEMIDRDDVAEALGDFESLWDAMTPREQVRLMHLLVSRVDYDAADSSIEVSFHPAGIRALADETRTRDSQPPAPSKPNSKEAAA